MHIPNKHQFWRPELYREPFNAPVQPTLIEQSSFGVLEAAVEEWLASPSVCSVDAEWPPSGSHKSSHKSSHKAATVLQLAVWSPASSAGIQSFVLDLTSLDVGELSPLLKRVFRAGNLLKVGYGLSSDIKALSRALGDSTMSILQSVVDLCVLHRQNKLCGDGLSNLVLAHLGYPLDKSQQCSDWGSRPLSEEQLLYASTDACCLLALLNEFACRWVGENGVSLVEGVNKVSELWGEVWHWTGHRIEKKGKKALEDRFPFSKASLLSKAGQKKDRLPPCRAYPTNIPWETQKDHPSSPKFLVDVMLYGLARQLRLWGIDTESIETVPKGNRHFVHRQLVERAVEEGRIILTCDVVFLTRGLSDQAYYVKTYDGNSRQQLLDVIDDFKLRSVIKRDSLLSRCARCNGEFGNLPVAGSALTDRCSVPSEVRRREELEFWECQRCGAAYWQGSMYARAMERLTAELEALQVL